VREQKKLKKALQDPHAWRRGAVALQHSDGRQCTSKAETAQIIRDFYNTLYASRVSVTYEPREEQEGMQPLLRAEIESALKSMRRGTAPGCDDITTDMLRAGSDLLTPALTSIFNNILESGQPPRHLAD